MDVDVSEKLQSVKVPLLYLRANEDRVVPAAAAKHIVQIVPAANVECLDAPHFLLQVAPEAAADAIATFVRQTQVRARPREPLIPSC